MQEFMPRRCRQTPDTDDSAQASRLIRFLNLACCILNAGMDDPCGRLIRFLTGVTRFVIESAKIQRCRRQPNDNPKRKREMIKCWRIVRPRLSLSSALACTSGCHCSSLVESKFRGCGRQPRNSYLESCMLHLECRDGRPLQSKSLQPTFVKRVFFRYETKPMGFASKPCFASHRRTSAPKPHCPGFAQRAVMA